MRQTVTGDDRLLQQLRTPSPGTFAGKQEHPEQLVGSEAAEKQSVPSVEGPRWPLLIVFALLLTGERWHYLIGISKRILWLLFRKNNRRAVQQ